MEEAFLSLISTFPSFYLNKVGMLIFSISLSIESRLFLDKTNENGCMDGCILYVQMYMYAYIIIPLIQTKYQKEKYMTWTETTESVSRGKIK